MTEENKTNRSEETFYAVGGIAITVGQVMDLVVRALEGGSNYWYWILESAYPVDESKVPEGEWNLTEWCIWGGGYLKICELTTLRILNEDALKKGLDLMVTKKYINHFANFVTEEYDANTADIFLQLCLFGEVLYG